MARRLMTWALVAIVLLGAVPVLSVLAVAAFDSTVNCELGESDPFPCVIFGFEFAVLMYKIGIVSIWSLVVTVPLTALALIVWLIVLIVLLLIRRHRRARAKPVSE
jgi:hypothetical protein